MNTTYAARTSITINVPKSRVWEALTNPQLIKQYLFDTEVTTDWKVGSPITYKGIWEGKPFEDKGKVLQIEEVSSSFHLLECLIRLARSAGKLPNRSLRIVA